MANLPEYRENPKRCIYLNGTIDQKLVDRLTPEIIGLKHASHSPITVYIDSFGGQTAQARLLMDLLRAPDQDGNKCRTITVATGTAGSAAADFLVWGDYALAYPNAKVWFHGTRQPAGDRVTTEDAAFIAESLKRRNEGFALDLANAALSRFFFRYVNLRSQFADMRRDAPQMHDVECLALSIVLRLSTEFGLPIEAIKKHSRLSDLTNYLSQEQARDKHPPKDEMHREAKLLKRLIDFKVREKKKESKKQAGWEFKKKGLQEIQDDFSLFMDYHLGEHMKSLKDQVLVWGPICLEENEVDEYGEIASEREKEEWLLARTEPKIKPIWQLLVSICRLLQQGEHVLNAKDAYWLGLIDEVVGARFPSIRVIMEDRAQKAEAAKQPEEVKADAATAGATEAGPAVPAT